MSEPSEPPPVAEGPGPDSTPTENSPIRLTEEGRIHYEMELQGLSNEKIALIQTLNSDRTFALVASGAIWSWFGTNSPEEINPWLIWLPAILTALFVVKTFWTHKSIGMIAKYVQDLERQIGLPETVGWERWLGKNKPNKSFNYLFWSVLLGGNLLVGIWMHCSFLPSTALESCCSPS